MFSFHDILATEDIARTFAQDVGLVPKPDQSCPACPECGADMKVIARKYKRAKILFEYVCSKNNLDNCKGTVSKIP